MTLTDEEAREIVENLAGNCSCNNDDCHRCRTCGGTGTRPEARRLITLLESRMDAGRKERG